MHNDRKDISPPTTRSRKRASGATGEEIIQTSFRLPRSRWAKLQELSIAERSSVQAIIVGALEAEFARRGLAF